MVSHSSNEVFVHPNSINLIWIFFRQIWSGFFWLKFDLAFFRQIWSGFFQANLIWPFSGKFDLGFYRINIFPKKLYWYLILTIWLHIVEIRYYCNQIQLIWSGFFQANLIWDFDWNLIWLFSGKFIITQFYRINISDKNCINTLCWLCETI